MSVNYIETGSLDPCYNLAFEEYLLTDKTRGSWLMLWQNANTLVVGLNQNTAEEINADFVSRHGITVVRRSTGGGAVYHDLGNLNYSFITDAGDVEKLSIERFALPVCRALGSMGLDAALGGRNDILVNGRKVSGVAQRLYRGRILHHGTLLFSSDPDMIAGALRVDPDKFRSKSMKSVRSRVGNISDFLPTEMSLEQFKRELLAQLSLDGLERRSLDGDELRRIERAADEKYRSWDWTYGRNPSYSYKNRARFPGGGVEVCMNVEKGVIADIDFSGDYMALSDNGPVIRALTGVRLRREEVYAALSRVDLTPVFGDIGAEAIAELILMYDS